MFFDEVDMTPLMCFRETQSEYEKQHNCSTFTLLYSRKASVYQFKINIIVQSVPNTVE